MPRPIRARNRFLIADMVNPGWKFALHQIAAAIGHGICNNHPFVDGNKRTAFISTAVFLEMHGFRANAPEIQVVRVMNALAGGEMNEQEFAEWLERTFARSGSGDRQGHKAGKSVSG